MSALRGPEDNAIVELDHAGYYSFRDDDGNPYGSFEVFYGDVDGERGWYWRACMPGCLPDGEPNGPFALRMLAIEDARDE